MPFFVRDSIFWCPRRRETAPIHPELGESAACLNQTGVHGGGGTELKKNKDSSLKISNETVAGIEILFKKEDIWIGTTIRNLSETLDFYLMSAFREKIAIEVEGFFRQQWVGSTIK
ncbi:hypothetical protein RJ639_031175 [Escallonia herrerae]|uniref:Uncharacterized protein n=1 Tax=Escallonia herrerae TaxID=1293975 RepID=A0AA89BGU3_9ASTE|nr:hypothetical protein RJ639_031175 [Escallonia herrerae]